MPEEVYQAVFSKVEESTEGKLWHVEAIHATTTRNNRIYTEEELRLAARSLSKRPINYNHDESRFLPYDFKNPFGPLSNSTVFMEYDSARHAVVGDLWITDAHANSMIEAGKIQTVSIEQTPTKGESCSLAANIRTCEQRGIVFDAIGILETYKGVEPGDQNALIKPKESVKKEDDDDEEPPKKCDDGYHYDKEQDKCVKDDDKEEPKESKPCPCALERALGTELFNELKKAEKFLTSSSI